MCIVFCSFKRTAGARQPPVVSYVYGGTMWNPHTLQHLLNFGYLHDTQRTAPRGSRLRDTEGQPLYSMWLSAVSPWWRVASAWASIPVCRSGYRTGHGKVPGPKDCFFAYVDRKYLTEILVMDILSTWLSRCNNRCKYRCSRWVPVLLTFADASNKSIGKPTG